MPTSRITLIKHKTVKSTPCTFPPASNRLWQSNVLFAGLLLALFAFTPASFGANGAANYLDFDGPTPGFGTPTDTVETNTVILNWSTSATGTAVTTNRVSGSQLT